MRAGRLVVDVADLRRRAGTRRRIQRSAVLDELAVGGVAVVPETEVEVEAVIESISDQVVVDGTVRAQWVGSCRRCLEEVRGRVEADVREVFEPRPVEGETYPLAGEVLDLEPMVRDAVLLNLPLAPLCDAACQGPDPDHPVWLADGRTGGTDDAGDGDPDDATAGDPRWAALRELRFD